MRKLYVLSFALACAYLFPLHSSAQDTCTAAFTATGAGNTVNFFSSPHLPASTIHNWIFGDGSPGDGSPNPAHTYVAAGTYFVKHYIFNQSTNCNDSVVKEIHVPFGDCNITPAFTFYRDSLDCHKIHFVNQSVPSSTAAHFVWQFGDGTTSTDLNPTHVYPKDSNYNVCLRMETGNNCSKQVCNSLEVHCTAVCNLQPAFIWKIEPENARRVFFYNQTILPSTNVKYEWKFGDGTSSDQRDPVHVYEHTGDYEVCLTARTGDNCKNTICQRITIRECDVHAKFESRRDTSDWKKIWFSNLSQPVSNIWRTEWTYGDGTSSQDFNTFHVYQQAGKYHICLKVQSLRGCIDAYCDSIVVRKPDTCENHADFRFEPAANNPLEIRFKPAQVNLTWKYYWDFGDGKSSTAVTPIHKYDHGGGYRVCLTVVTLNRCRTNSCKQVTVGNLINCDTVKLKFTYTRTQEHPNSLTFYAVSNVPLLKEKWSIVKMNTTILPPPIPVIIEGNNPTYTFRDTGWYMVCLDGTTAGDCNKVYCDKVHIERLGNVAETPGSSVSVIPNPATNSAMIEFQMEQAGPVTFRILDAAGAAQLSLSAEGQAGMNRVNIPVNKLSNGFYVVEIRYANRLKLAKFQKS